MEFNEGMRKQYLRSFKEPLTFSSTCVACIFQSDSIDSITEADFDSVISEDTIGPDWLSLIPNAVELRRYVFNNFQGVLDPISNVAELDFKYLAYTSSVNVAGTPTFIFVGLCDSFVSINTTRFSVAYIIKCPEEVILGPLTVDTIVKLPNIRIQFNI